MQVMAFAVRALRDLDAVVPAVKALGQRHVGYGVKLEHYMTVGAALLWTLERGLGPDFTPEVKAAWAAVYGLLAQTATDGVYVSEPAQPSPEPVVLAPAL
jgi:nitric oxide dioxygenase